MFYFDVDGVIRDVNKALEIDPSSWENWTDHHYNLINGDPEKYLIDCPVHRKVLNFINNGHNHVHFITNQKGIPSWEEATIKFLKRYVHINHDVTFVSNFEQKLDLLIDKDYLLDDYPYYNEKNVIMMARPWNKYYREGKIVWDFGD